MHVNQINNKKYIGITKQVPEKRWGNNGKRYTSSSHFYNAIRKYGWDNFKHLILYQNMTGKEAREKEVKLIAHYNTLNNKFGYNQTKGGDGCLGFKMSKESRNKMKLIASNRVRSNETREKMRRIMTGRKFTQEWKNKIRDGRFGENNPSAKEIVQLDTNYKFIKYFPYMRMAEKELGINISHISATCLGKEKTASGFVFMYYDDYMKNKDKLVGKNVSYKSLRPVNQYTLEGEFIRRFDSISQAGNYIGLNPSGIKNVCRGNAKTSGGYKWEYAS